MTAYLVGLWDGSSSMPGRYPVIFYALSWLLPWWVVAVPLAVTLALFFVRSPAWFFCMGDRLFGEETDR